MCSMVFCFFERHDYTRVRDICTLVSVVTFGISNPIRYKTRYELENTNKTGKKRKR